MTTTVMTRVGAGLTLLTVLAFSPAVWAHAHLKSQQPAAESTVSTPLQALTLDFTQNIEPAFSGVEVLNADKQPLTIANTLVAPEKKDRMVVTLTQPVPAGRYVVNWHVLSADGHKLKGSYNLTVK